MIPSPWYFLRALPALMQPRPLWKDKRNWRMIEKWKLWRLPAPSFHGLSPRYHPPSGICLCFKSLSFVLLWGNF